MPRHDTESVQILQSLSEINIRAKSSNKMSRFPWQNSFVTVPVIVHDSFQYCKINIQKNVVMVKIFTTVSDI